MNAALQQFIKTKTFIIIIKQFQINQTIRFTQEMNLQQQQNNIENSDLNHQYLKLIEIVGSNHKYQRILIALFSCMTFLTGMLSLGTPYYLAVNPYQNCPQPYNTPDKCDQYVCSIPKQQRTTYNINNSETLRTLANEFGDYRCQKSNIISITMGMFFLGALVGYIILGSMVDIIGRRLSLLISLGIGSLGLLLILLAGNIVLVDIGLFLVGFGLENSMNLVFFFLTQTFADRYRQKAGIITQFAYCLGTLTIIAFFYLFKNWKIIFWIFLFVPTILISVLSYIFIKQTPQFLIKRYDVQEIRSIFQFIAKLNNKMSQFEESEELTIKNLIVLKQQYKFYIQNSKRNIFTFKDLFMLKSLRKTTILVGIIIFSIDILYYGPILLIDRFGFNFYANGIILNCAELSSYILSYLFITKIKRKLLSQIIFLSTFVFSFILLFINQRQICTDNCWSPSLVIQLIIIFLMRFCVGLYYSVLLIYINELYPVQVAGLGLSHAAIVAMVPNLFIPLVINAFNQINVSFMIVFIIFSAIPFSASFFLKETRGLKPIEKVAQFVGGQVSQRPAQIQLVQQKD